MPWHMKRTWSVQEMESIDELAEALTDHSWCLCCGFRYRDLLFLNDALSEDGAQEFAVLRDLPDGGHEQIESLTASWMSKDEMTTTIASLAAGGGEHLSGRLKVRLDHGDGYCEHCA